MQRASVRAVTHADRPYLGALLMVAFCLIVPLADAIAKMLGPTVTLLTLLMARFALQWMILLPLARLGGKVLRVPRELLGLIVLRTLLHMAGTGLMFISLRFLPLAETIAIAFVMPLLLLLLGHWVLGEQVGRRRMLACVVGFLGTLLVVQPSFANVGAPAMLPLLVALTFAGFILATRPIAQRVDPITLQAVSGLIGSALLLPVWLLGAAMDWPDFELVQPNGEEMLLLVAIGLLGTGGHLLMTWSLRFAPSASLAPIQYLEIPVAAAVGWLIFGDIPDRLAVLGIVITIAAGLFVLMAERRDERTRLRDAAQPGDQR